MAVLDRFTRNCCCSWEAAEKEVVELLEEGKDRGRTGSKKEVGVQGEGIEMYFCKKIFCFHLQFFLIKHTHTHTHTFQVEMTSCCCSWSPVPFGVNVVVVVWPVLLLLLLLELTTLATPPPPPPPLPITATTNPESFII